MKYIPIILLSAFLVSCGASKKTVYVEKTTEDSSVRKERDYLFAKIQELKEYYEKKLSDSSGITIDFNQPDTNNSCPCDDTLALVTTTNPPKNKVIFDNGKLKSAEGNLAKITVTNKQLLSEITNRDARIEELSLALEKAQTETHKSSEIRYVEKKSKSWWWVWLIIGFAIRHFLPLAGRFIYTKVHPFPILKRYSK